MTNITPADSERLIVISCYNRVILDNNTPLLFSIKRLHKNKKLSSEWSQTDSECSQTDGVSYTSTCSDGVRSAVTQTGRAARVSPPRAGR